MYARLATFQGDPAEFDDAIAGVREQMAGGPRRASKAPSS